jgi:hypothetical protein
VDALVHELRALARVPGSALARIVCSSPAMRTVTDVLFDAHCWFSRKRILERSRSMPARPSARRPFRSAFSSSRCRAATGASGLRLVAGEAFTSSSSSALRASAPHAAAHRSSRSSACPTARSSAGTPRARAVRRYPRGWTPSSSSSRFERWSRRPRSTSSSFRVRSGARKRKRRASERFPSGTPAPTYTSKSSSLLQQRSRPPPEHCRDRAGRGTRGPPGARGRDPRRMNWAASGTYGTAAAGSGSAGSVTSKRPDVLGPDGRVDDAVGDPTGRARRPSVGATSRTRPPDRRRPALVVGDRLDHGGPPYAWRATSSRSDFRSQTVERLRRYDQCGGGGDR